jgi:hypothetical protein
MAKNGYWVLCYKFVSNPSNVSEYAKLAATEPEVLGGRVIGGKPAKRGREPREGDSRV